MKEIIWIKCKIIMIMQKSRENCFTNYKAVYCIDYAPNTYFLSYRIALALMSSSERKGEKNNNESKSSKKFIAITDESRVSHRLFFFQKNCTRLTRYKAKKNCLRKQDNC